MSDLFDSPRTIQTETSPNQSKVDKEKLKCINKHFISLFFLLMMLFFPHQFLQQCVFAIFGIVNSLLLLYEKEEAWKMAVFLEFLAFPLVIGGTSDLSLIPPFLLLPSFLLTMYFSGSSKLATISAFIQVASTHIIFLPLKSTTVQKEFGQEIVLMYREAVKINTLVTITLVGIVLFFDWKVNNYFESTEKLKGELSNTNNELNTKKNELERNLETEELFLLTFSHELKNSLNGLLGNLSLALESVVDPEVFGYLKQAKVCGHILRNFILNILESGKIERSSLQVTYERTDSSEWFSKLWMITCEIIRNKRLKGFMKISKNVPKFLQIDQQRLFQIVLNLTSNAVKFTKEGQVYFMVDWEDGDETMAQTGEIVIERNESSSNDDSGERTPCFVKDRSSFGFSEFAISRGMSIHDLGVSISRGVSAHELGVSIPDLGDDEKGDVSTFKIPYARSPRNQKDSFLMLDFGNRSLDSDAFVAHNESSTGILKISVIDSGCGMNKDQISKLFQKFSQVGTASEQKFGTGLGLWISKELAEKMNGTIQVKSTPGVGSVFEVRIQTTVLADCPLVHRVSSFLPRKDFNLKWFLQGEELKKAPSLTPSQQKKKVLIADDDAFNIDLMINYLRKLKCDYIVAYNGEELVKAVEDHYDEILLILTDNHMPIMNGIDAIKEIRSYLLLEMKPMLPAYLITGDHKMSENTTLAELGIEKFLSKPIEFHSFKEIIQSHFEE